MTDHIQYDEHDVDQDEGMSAAERYEYDRTTEFVLDAQDEERDAEEQRKAEAAEGRNAEDDGECAAEFIDGSYTYCGCPDCNDREAADREMTDEEPS
ncbi:hypothetical protein [Streptomyces niveus]|uniref:hypothetical protein n=1 Tax=Streptomyces niveus TaxID=193462 RepID=UPI0033BB560A